MTLARMTTMKTHSDEHDDDQRTCRCGQRTHPFTAKLPVHQRHELAYALYLAGEETD